MSTHVFGIRHHGPGSARSLVAALRALEPDAVLIEGPPDADAILPLAADPAMTPPVAILIHAADRPGQAVFYPFADYSPEWQAMRFALERGVAVRFIDLPQAIRMAAGRRRGRGEGDGGGADAGGGEGDGGGEGAAEANARIEADAEDEVEADADSSADAEAEAEADPDADGRTARDAREDPLGLLSEAAGFADREMWWEREVEARRDPAGLFEGIALAMTALRETQPPPGRWEARREAHMRQSIRAARRAGFQRIAVVCGAWHSPALHRLGPAKRDAELLRGLAKIKVACTWIPWTTSRLCWRSGYGAGVESPGWYRLLWEHRDRAAVQWAARAARLLRAEDLDASSASVIEAVRLADALAALRDLSAPGLAELRDAVQSVLCQGEPAPMALIRDRLEIGHDMGAVPAGAAVAPLQREVEAEQRRLRMKVSAEPRTLELDLRRPNDRARGRLLRRLALLDVAWGRVVAASGQTGAGTFREHWNIRWQPEMVVALVEASVHGNTLEAAAAGHVRARAGNAELPELTQLLDAAVVAEVPAAVEHLLAALEARAALSDDAARLLDALPPLVQVVRYGDVRGTRSEQVRPVLAGLFARALVGLPGACVQIGDDAAAALAASIDGAHEAILLLDDPALRAEWLDLLASLVERDPVHALLRGRFCRRLLEGARLGGDELARMAALALSPAVDPARAAAWIEGLVGGSGLVLAHLAVVWTVLDGWLSGLAADAFARVLPLLRRAFSGFAPAERRQMGGAVARLRPGAAGAGGGAAGRREREIDEARAALVLPVLAHILGVPHEPR
ncbi:MAG TPA: DUF5682 family protein [Kofleriaceae bacterium]|nr:DUF5682 family protein [Kofleriaceae bacterium]